MSVLFALATAALIWWLAIGGQLRSQRVALLRAATGQQEESVAHGVKQPSLLEKLGGGLIDAVQRRTNVHFACFLNERDRISVAAVVVIAGPLAYVASIGLALVVVTSALVVIGVGARSRVKSRHEQIARQLPTVVDLFRLCIGAGMNVPMALRAVSGRVVDPLGPLLRAAATSCDKGMRTADALQQLCEASKNQVRPLIDALLASERYGAPVSVSLEQLSAEHRLHQDRKAEQTAKKLSVQLLFPLAGCVLPAFALLTVVPLLAGSFSTLANSFS